MPPGPSLAEHYDDHQMIEVCMVVGQYHLVAFTLNALGVEREPGIDGFPVTPAVGAGPVRPPTRGYGTGSPTGSEALDHALSDGAPDGRGAGPANSGP